MQDNKDIFLEYQKRMKELGLSKNIFAQSLSEQTKTIINNIKKRDRQTIKLSEWNNKQYKKRDVIRQLEKIQQAEHNANKIQRVSAKDLSVQQFIDKYQKLDKPVIIKNITQNWKAKQKWTFKYFYENYKQDKFKIGQDDDGVKLKITFENYLEYLVHNDDDSPLYLFETNLENDLRKRQLIKDYQVPKYFEQDLLKYAGDKLRPPYRWILMGPQRSGSPIHIDPNNTSAWNTSLVGRKRWVLFPQDIPKSIVYGTKYKGNQDQAIDYFLNILPKMKQDQTLQNLKIMQFIQQPGETVFVPRKWWHAVINIDDTIAVTQNVMTSHNFQMVWTSLRMERNISVLRALYHSFQTLNPILFNKIKLNEQKIIRKSNAEQENECNLSQSDKPKIQTLQQLIIQFQYPNQSTFQQEDDFFEYKQQVKAKKVDKQQSNIHVNRQTKYRRCSSLQPIKINEKQKFDQSKFDRQLY